MWPGSPTLDIGKPFPVYFARACIVPQVEIGRFPSDFYTIQAEEKEIVIRRDPTNDGDLPRKLLELYSSSKVTAYTEYRQKLLTFQPDGLAEQFGFLNHVFMVLEVDDGDHYICTERYGDPLELLIGRGEASRTFMMKFRPTGDERRTPVSAARPRQKLCAGIKLSEIIDWMDRTVSCGWKPYDFVHSNSLHWATELQRYLLSSSSIVQLSSSSIVQSVCQQWPLKSMLAEPASSSRPLTLQERQAKLQKLAAGELMLHDAGESLRGDREAVLAAVRRNGKALQYADEALREDREIVSVAVAKDGRMLEFASKRLKADREVALTAIFEDSRALPFVDHSLWAQRSFVASLVRQDGLWLRFASAFLRRDRDIVWTAVMQDGIALAYADDNLKNDEEIVLAAVTRDGRAFQHATSELRCDKRFVKMAVKHAGRPSERSGLLPGAALSGTPHGDNDPPVPEEEEDELDALPNREASVLAYASEELRSDRDFVLSVVEISGWLLEHAAEELREDRDVVMAAVCSCGRALQFANEAFRHDRELVLRALGEDGLALKFVGDSLKEDPEVVLAAVRQEPRAAQFVTVELCKRPEIAEVLKTRDAPLEYELKDKLDTNIGFDLAFLEDGDSGDLIMAL